MAITSHIKNVLTKASIAVVFIIIVAIVTGYVLSILVPTLTEDSSSQPSRSAAEIVASYKSRVLPQKTSDYTFQPNATSGTLIEHRPGNSTYKVASLSTNAAAYTKKSVSDLNNTVSVIEDTHLYLDNTGLKKVTPVSRDGTTKTAYFSANTVCQITQYAGTAAIDSSPAISASFSLGCVAIDAITSEQKKIDSLLSLYKQSSDLTNISLVATEKNENDLVRITVVYVIHDDTKSNNFRAYFASIGENKDLTTYVGKQTTVGTESTQKIERSNEIETNLRNPVWGQLLAETLEKY